ncbi:MAG: prepilin-type N-terminal cleavage/methylation domain-containing protein [Kiritimatiellae bacterium]|nr:prepilin-type N-terminal cleavage/methylation domain-containing protein [Kiritimatiellia bacterium]
MKKGFTLVEIMIVVAIIGLLAAIAIPSFMRARLTSQQNACINNMRQIEAAKDQFSLENGWTNGQAWSNDAAAFVVLVSAGSTPGGYIKAFPNCPASTNSASTVTKSAEASGNDYAVGAIGSNAACKVLGTSATQPHVLR